MTKEELEKEAEEYANNLVFVYETDIVQRIVRERVRLALIDVLESREKQIQINAEQIRALQKQNGELTDRVAELEAQIEKMKLCNICKHYQWESCNYHSLSEKDCKANNHSLFELVGDKRK